MDKFATLVEYQMSLEDKFLKETEQLLTGALGMAGTCPFF